MDMDRREFLAKMWQSAAVAAVTGSAGMACLSCSSETGQKPIASRRDYEVPPDPQFASVVLATNEDHAEALRSALDAIGGIRRFVRKGERVLLKPNVAFDRAPKHAVNTNPVLVGEMTRLCLAAGAADVVVTDHSGSDNQRRVFSTSGIKDAVEMNGGRVAFLDDTDFIEADFNGKLIRKWPVLKHALNVDRLINMPIAKHHDLALGTASMKNFFGAIGGYRAQLHAQLDQAIVDLASFFRPTLTIVDATRVLMRHGPVGGSFDDVRTCNSVICATDQVAADSRACEFVGRAGREISYIVLAAEQGLGKIDYHEAGYREVL